MTDNPTTETATVTEVVADDAPESVYNPDHLDAQEDATPGDAEDDRADPARKARQEAKNLRSRAKEAEAERDALTEQLSALTERVAVVQRGEVQRLAEAAGMRDGADLWLAGTELESLRDDAGDIDPGLVRDAVSTTLSEHPGWGPRPTPATRPVAALQPGAAPVALGSEARTSWADLLR